MSSLTDTQSPVIAIGALDVGQRALKMQANK
jgi:hypothetical protein